MYGGRFTPLIPRVFRSDWLHARTQRQPVFVNRGIDLLASIFVTGRNACVTRVQLFEYGGRFLVFHVHCSTIFRSDWLHARTQMQPVFVNRGIDLLASVFATGRNACVTRVQLFEYGGRF